MEDCDQAERMIEPVTNLTAIYSTQKTAIGASVPFVSRKQGRRVDQNDSRALNVLGNLFEYQDCC